MDSYKDIWKLVLGQLSKKYSDAAMELWFNNLNLVYLDDSIAIITTQRDGFVSLLNKKYVPDMEEILEEILSFRVKVRIYAETGFDLERAVASFDEPEESPKPQEILRKTGSGDDFYSDDKTEKTITSFDANYTFENFVVGESNKFAYKASRAVADNPTAYNPLFIYGQSGLGKTHLMKAIATEVLKRNPDYNVIIVKGESFTNELVEALAKKDTAGFKEKYRRADMLLIDDIQFIAGKVATQEEFFHTFNALYESNKQIVLTSDRPPKDINPLNERLRSRFEGGLMADVGLPNLELRVAILKKKAEDLAVDIPTEVLTYLAENLRSNIRQIEGSIKKLAAKSMVDGRKISLELARECLADLMGDAEPLEVTIDKIFSAVVKRYNIPREDIVGLKRTKEIMHARHVTIFLMREITELSTGRIGDIFGRDHSTVMSSCKWVRTKMAREPLFAADIEALKNEITEN